MKRTWMQACIIMQQVFNLHQKRRVNHETRFSQKGPLYFSTWSHMSSQTSGSTSADTGNQADWVWLGASGPHAMHKLLLSGNYVSSPVDNLVCHASEVIVLKDCFFPKPWNEIFQRHAIIVTLMLIIFLCQILYRMLWTIWQLCCLCVLQQHRTHLDVFFVKRIT